MTIGGNPAVLASVQDEERRSAAPPPTPPPEDDDPVNNDPPPPPPDTDGDDFIGSPEGALYPADALYLPSYSGNNTWNPYQSGHGSKFTYTSGSWERSTAELSAETGTNFGGNTRARREPTPGDQAKLTFAGGRVLYAGRIDGRDRGEMNTDDKNFDGVQNGVGSGYDGRPAAANSLITTGNGLKDGPFDPAIFPTEVGPHRHSMATANVSFWNDTNLKGSLGGNPTPATDLSNPFLRNVMERTSMGFNVALSMLMYWPTFVHGVARNGASNSGYVGRPRNVAGVPNAELPTYQGDVVPPPFGLRMATFKCGVFQPTPGAAWTFTFAFPCCWDGVNEWLPLGAHMAFLDPSTGQPPASHPFVIPFVHWFVTINAPTSWTRSQAFNSQSAQVTDDNPAAMYYGQRRDFWNYNNTFVPPHAELLWAWDPVFAEAMAWMINNHCGVGRANQRGDLGND